MMNTQLDNKPLGEPLKTNERRIDLKAAYRVLIRAYLRQRNIPPRASEVKHG